MGSRDVALCLLAAMALAGLITVVGCGSGSSGLSLDTCIGQDSGGIQGSTADIILFISLRAGSNGEVFAVDSEGVRTLRLTATGYHDETPAWSPDGTQFCFSATSGARADLYRARIDNTLVAGPEGEDVYFYQMTDDMGYNMCPDWSVNDVIACHSDRDGGELEIYTMDVYGNNQTRLTFDAEHSSNHPSWSPDGAQIAFSSNRLNATPEIFVMEADGSNPRRLTTTQTGWASLAPAWSPDGSRIAYVLQDPEGDREIYTMDANGGSHTQLTSVTDDGGKGNHNPSWSPDSERIAFERFGREQIPDVWVMDADGSNKVQLTSDNERDASPAWSPAVL